MDALTKELEALHARWAPLDTRVAEILENIRRDCANRLPGESHNRANERQVEEFIARLREEFAGRTYDVVRGGEPGMVGQPGLAGKPGTDEIFAARWEHARRRRETPCVVIERQRLSPWALRTTRWNFVFTVPGESPEVMLLVAHYDTWRGPGADDNTTGEEILKQYLLADLRAEKRPRLTHVYFLAGSEECGLVGLLSQFLLAGALVAAIHCLQQRTWHLMALALALAPLASYRFGVSGSREYVRALGAEELRHLRAVVAVDSVGEGRMFIPRSTLGADFIRALVPFGDYDAFTDLLEEGAHLHGIKYNSYLAGGTTDHVSFLEVNNGLWARTRQLLARSWAWLAGKDYRAPRRIPASALVTMVPGKASPVVFGGKIHTPNDLPERVYPAPLRETLLILDYVIHILEGGARVREPRGVEDCHYARVYEISSRQGGPLEYWVILKDALEPNRRNLNMVYRAETELDEGRKEGSARVREPVGWGVHPRLRDAVRELAAERGKSYRRVKLDRLTVMDARQRPFNFGRQLSLSDQLHRRFLRALAWLERQAGRYSFITFFLVAYGIARLIGAALDWGFERSFAFQTRFFEYNYATVPLVLLVQLGVLLYLMVRPIPTWIDNNYRHDNRADNMGSLRRLRAEAAS